MIDQEPTDIKLSMPRRVLAGFSENSYGWAHDAYLPREGICLQYRSLLKKLLYRSEVLA